MWEAISGTPDVRLRGSVLDYMGYVERASAPMRRLEVPFAGVPMIVSFGPSILVDGVRHRSFVAGLDDRATVTEYTGEQRGIEVKFTPLGARRLLGLPMDELARRVVALEDVPGLRRPRRAPARRAGWPARFALLDGVLLRRLARRPAGRRPHPARLGAPARERRRGRDRRARAGGRLEPAPSRGALSHRGRAGAEGRRADPALRARDADAARERGRGPRRPRVRVRLRRPGAPQPRLPRVRRHDADRVHRERAARRGGRRRPASSQTSKTSPRARRSLAA